MRRAVLLLTGLLLTTLLAGALPATAQGNDPNPQANNWVVSTYDVTFNNLTYVDVDGTLRFHKIFYDGESYSADDARDLYDVLYQQDPERAEDLVSDFENKITQRFRAAMTDFFGDANLDVTPATLDRSTLNTTEEGKDAYHPPLVFTVAAEGPVNLTAIAGGDVNRTEVDVALQLGATLDVPFPVKAPAGTNLTLRLDVPNDLAIESADGATVGPLRQVATTTVRNWQEPAPQEEDVLLTVHDPDETRFEEQEASLHVVVDAKGLDLKLLRLADGSLGNARADVRAQGTFHVLQVPEGSVGLGQADITHISASDLRLLVREGIVERGTLTNFAAGFVEGFAADAPENVEITVSGGFEAASLDLTPSEEVNETHPPVTLDMLANINMDLTLSQPQGQQAAITLFDTRQSFELQPMNGMPTTYEIILPKGTTLLDAQAPDGAATTHTNDEGRTVLTVTTEDEPVETQAHVAITPSFLWYQTPELLALALVALLLPIALITRAIMVRRDRDGEQGPEE